MANPKPKKSLISDVLTIPKPFYKKNIHLLINCTFINRYNSNNNNNNNRIRGQPFSVERKNLTPRSISVLYRIMATCDGQL